MTDWWQRGWNGDVDELPNQRSHARAMFYGACAAKQIDAARACYPATRLKAIAALRSAAMGGSSELVRYFLRRIRRQDLESLMATVRLSAQRGCDLAATTVARRLRAHLHWKHGLLASAVRTGCIRLISFLTRFEACGKYWFVAAPSYTERECYLVLFLRRRLLALDKTIALESCLRATLLAPVFPRATAHARIPPVLKYHIACRLVYHTELPTLYHCVDP